MSETEPKSSVLIENTEWLHGPREGGGSLAMPIASVFCITDDGGKWRPIQVVNGHQIPFDRGFDTLEEAATVLTLPDQFKRMEVYVAQRPERHLASGVVACLMGWALATVWAIDLRQIVAGAVLMLTVSLVHDAIDAERLAR
jgi:hypothetical protein